MKYKMIAVVVVAAIAIVASVHMSDLSAAEGNLDWDDVTEATVSFTSLPGGERKWWHHGDCREERSVVERLGKIEELQICVTHSPNAALASYVVSGSNTASYALRKSTDTNYHQLSNVQSPARPVLTQDDTLLTIDTAQKTMLQFVSIKDIHLKLQEASTQNGPSEFSKIYVANISQGEVVRDGYNNPLQVHSIAASKNSRFAAVGIFGGGVAIVDLETHLARLISGLNSPSHMMNLAVSDDGKIAVATGGDLEGQKIYVVDDGCGVSNTLERSVGVYACYEVDFTDELRQYAGAATTYYAEVEAPNNRVVLHRWSGSSAARDRILLDPNPSNQRLKYLALGDSFSSGEGDTARDEFDQKYYRAFTDIDGDTKAGVPREKCHVSTRSYPYLLALDMDLALEAPKQWDTIACSGATAEDVRSSLSGTVYDGQGGRLQASLNASALKSSALNEMIPGRLQQIDFVKKYKPKVITLTMGGNDIGFGDKISACASPVEIHQTCVDATEDGRGDLGHIIRSQYDSLRALYEDIAKASGYNAKIYVLGYPQFVNNSADASCKNTAGLNDAERTMMYEGVAYFNTVIAQAAKASGVKYVDIEGSLHGGRLCDDGQEYVTAITGFNGWKGNELAESFHPNDKGHAQIASDVLDVTGSKSLIDYGVCPVSAKRLCPDFGAIKDGIDVPAYFQTNQPDKNRKYSHMTLGEYVKSAVMHITIPPHSFAANSVVNLVMKSDPIDLGEYSTSDDGSFEVDVAIPASIPVGYHTLIATGRDSSGVAVQYEQIVFIQGSDADDRDENGISDDRQKCGPFMEESGKDIDRDGVDDACDSEVVEPPVLSPPDPTPEPPVEPTSPTESPVQHCVTVLVTLFKFAIVKIKKLFGW